MTKQTVYVHIKKQNQSRITNLENDLFQIGMRLIL